MNVPVEVPGLSSVVAVTGGYYHTCVIVSNRTVQCWGDAFYGQLGNNDPLKRSSLIPVAVYGLTDVAAIAGGWTKTCALMGNGDVACWYATRIDGLLRCPDRRSQ